ncbi:MAG: endonuclease domain-containing protein [Oscillospiraceae bacterium]|nr:endonuclease domain-containing protein [Oscillospiraceae bacterium]
MLHPRNSGLLKNARELRKNMTEEEKKLWFLFLRNHRYRFRRQEIIGNYIADFYCKEIKLVIELDGSQHFREEKVLYDKERTDFFESLGISIIRIPNVRIDKEFENVCKYIDIIIEHIRKGE